MNIDFFLRKKLWILAAVLGGILILYCVSFAESEQALPGDIEEQDVVLSDDDYFSDAESKQVLPWDIEEQTVVLSYDDYFSDVREYDGNDIRFGRGRGDYVIRYEEPHISLHNWVRDEFLWDIADIDGCNWFTLGEQWIYCVVNQTTLLRMDYWGENREILFVDETGLLGKYAEVRTQHYLFKDETLFFIAGSKDKLGIYRIYLPTRTVDVMYDEIPLTAINLDLNKPVSNHEITWTDGNPEFFAFYESLSSDWSSLHENTPYNSDEAIGMVELDYRIYSAREHYINTATNTYKEIPFGYVYLPKPRSDENVELNGEAWWKDE